MTAGILPPKATGPDPSMRPNSDGEAVNQGDPLYFKAMAAADAGNRPHAIQYLRQAIALQPDNAIFLRALSDQLLSENSYQEAIGHLEHALSLEPRSALTWYLMGAADEMMGRPRQALNHYRQCTKFEPDWAEAWYQQGIVLLRLDRTEEAVDALACATRHRPDWVAAWFELAAGYATIERYNEAIVAYRQLLTIDPNNAPAHFKIAGILTRRWRIEEAIVHCRKALELRPEDTTAKAALFELARHGCQWQLTDTLGSDLDRLTSEQLAHGVKTTEWPLLSLWRHADPQRNQAVAASWSRSETQRFDAIQDRPHFRHHPGKKRHPIRIGYLSGDFKVHAVAHQIRGLLRIHDRGRFQIHAYATNPSDGSDYRDQLIAACDYFTPIDTLEGRHAAERIYNDGIDILVDLSGYTMGSRMDILSLRPAPVQVSYLGFLGTSGASCIDYFITDRVVTPPEHATYFNEKLIYMPHCYQVNDDAMAIAAQPFDRAAMGLPQEAVVFCCFNQPFKINRRTFECWLQILKRVPRSVLWLLDHNQAARHNLSRTAEASGVDPGRLVFSEPIRIDLHLARLRLADLALDTFIYNGGATTANALWAGVPLVALLGNHFVSRMSASALMAVELPELVVHTPQAYCDKAVELGTDHEKRDLLRQMLAQNRATAPLFDTRLFARHLESAYETVMARFHDRRPPDAFSVKTIGSPTQNSGTTLPRPTDEETGMGGMHHEATQSRVQSRSIQPSYPLAAVEGEPDLGRMAQTAHDYIQQGHFDAAADIYRKMLIKAPQSADIHHLLGLVHAEQQQWAAARLDFNHAIKLDERTAAFHHGLGNALQAMGELDAACQAYRQALALHPDDADTWINLGNALYQRTQIEDAQQCYERALRLVPNSAIAMNNMGKSRYDRRDVDGALGWYNNALQIDPSYAEAHFNRAAALLLSGEYSLGWPAYEWRFKRKQAAHVYPHQLKGPRWNGEPYRDARLLVHGEQGLGDVLQFARFLPQVKALGGTLLLEAQSPLIPFLQTMSVADRIVAFSPGQPPAIPYDLHVSLQSLPNLFGTTVSRIPCRIPYLHADAAKVARWRQRLELNDDHRRIGLVWSCSDAASYRESRLEYLHPLLNLPGIQWYSLQKGSGEAQLAVLPGQIHLTHLGRELHDFSDTAAVIANLDLLISVDTAAVHVAGAMGAPVWVLLPFAGDWRWLMHPSKTPWYPSARLFRQARPGDWSGVVQQVRSELTAWLQSPERNFNSTPIQVPKGVKSCASH